MEKLTAPEKFRLLANRSVLTLYISGFLVLMNLMVSLTLFPLYIQFRGGGDFMIGLQSSIFAAASVLLRLYFGPLADSAGRRFPLVLGSFVFATSPLLVWASPNFLFMILARIYQAIGMGTFLSAASSSIADLVPDKVRGTALGFYRASISAAIMIGPFFGYRLIDCFGYAGLFTALSLTSFCAMLLLLTLKLPPVSLQYKDKTVNLKDLLGLFRIRNLLWCYIGIFITSITSGIVLTYTAVYLESLSKVISAPLFFSLFAAAGIFSAPLSGIISDRSGRKAVLIPLILFFGAGLIFMGSQAILHSWFSWSIPLIAGIGYAGSLSVFITWVVDSAPPHLRASALAFEESSIDIGNAVGVFTFGLLASVSTYSVLFAGLGVFTILFSFVVKILKK